MNRTRSIAQWLLAIATALVLLGLLLAGTSGATASSAGTRLTSDPASEYCPAYSPSGRQIAFVRWEAEAGLWVMNSDGTGQVRLSEGDVNCGFQWAPSGQRIVFTKSNEPQRGPFDVSLQTGVIRQLTNEPDVFTVSLSPNGHWIAFDGAGSGGYFQIFVMSADGQYLTSLTPELGFATQPAWSPNGRQIAFFDGSGISVMNANGSDVHGLNVISSDLVAAQSPLWSRDGRQIAFQGFTSSGPDLFVINADGSGLRDVSDGVRSRAMAWSPNGRRIVFTDWSAIYAVNADGRWPAWAPNGQTITFSAALDGQDNQDVYTTHMR
jgi:Tol biopolymer transport system component